MVDVMMDRRPVRATPMARAAFAHFRSITTRWMDNDIYGHINNVQYYSFFDTAVNGFLIENGALDPNSGDVIGLVVDTHCSYFAPLAFPQEIEAGLGVAYLGGSSVRYEIGIFTKDADVAAAQGHFVHVYVARDTRRPVALPLRLKEALASLMMQAGT
jgi:acyl-CoA thioester hydrolase